MRHARSSIGAVILLLSVAANGQVQVEWFSNEGRSHLLARSRASVADETNDTCTVSIVNAQPNCPWCKQFERCTQQSPSISSPFAASESTVATINKPPRLSAVTRSVAAQNVLLQPTSLQLTNRVTTVFENSGDGMPSNRGVVNASGEIFFRVPAPAVLDYEMEGSLQWAGGRAHVQLSGVPNTGADLSQGFRFNTNSLPPAQPAKLASKGSFSPGVYRLSWVVLADQISRGGSAVASMDLRLKVAAACDPVVGQAPPDPYLSEVTGLFGPYSSADHAAIAAEPILRAATDRDGRELGILVIRHKKTGSFYLTPPVMGSLLLARLRLGGAVDADDFNRSRDLAFQGCDGDINSYAFYASAHSHPRQPENPLSDDVFSGADFDGAIKDAKSTTRKFDRIYLFPPDRCIRSFKAQRGDAECNAIVCPQYYPRVQPVHNCPRGRDTR